MTRFLQTPPPHEEDSMDSTAYSSCGGVNVVAHLARADYFAVETLLSMSGRSKEASGIMPPPPPASDLTPPNSEDEQEETTPVHRQQTMPGSSELARLLLSDNPVAPTPTAASHRTCTPVSVIVRAPPRTSPPPPMATPAVIRQEPARPVVAIAPKPPAPAILPMMRADEALVQTALVPVGAVQLLVARPVQAALLVNAAPVARRAQALVRVQLRGLRQDVLQELPPEGPRPHAHGRAAVRLPVGGVRPAILALRRAVAPSAHPHGREALLLPAVRSALHAQRSLGQARQATRKQQARGTVATGAVRLSPCCLTPVAVWDSSQNNDLSC
ncbi:hypothetical protein MRX96_006265 [Rhipicephalus microplus]